MKRLSADKPVVAAAFVTVLLSAILLASGPIYADAVALSALQKDLASAPATDSGIAVETRVFPRNLAVTRDVIEAGLGEATAPVGADVFAQVEAGSFELSSPNGAAGVDLISFQHIEGIESRAKLVGGVWPEHRSQVYETAASQSAAEALDLELGDTFQVTSRRDPTIRRQIRVVGIYVVDDPGDPFWFGDDLVAEGSVTAAGFRTVGPFVVPLQTILEGLTPLRASTTWRALVRFEDLRVEDLGRLRSSIASLGDDLNRRLNAAMAGDLDGSSEITVATGLVRLLTEVDRSLEVTRAAVSALIVQIAIIAGYALALTASLLVITRRSETLLARARGASATQLLAAAIAEGIVLTVPAVLAAPYLAAVLLRTLNLVGPLASIGLEISPEPNSRSFAVTSAVAILAIGALAWPAFQAAKRTIEPGRHTRQRAGSAASRLGVDIALVALALIAFWQLRESATRGGPGGPQGTGLDALLIISPGLGLLAGSILALRVIPLLSRIAERMAASSRGSLATLASWQVARRPTRYARSGLLIIMAVALGLFAASYTTTWAQSQRDQAAHSVGADIRLIPDVSHANTLSDLLLSSSHEAIEGVDRSMPTQRRLGSLVSGEGPVEFVTIDAEAASMVVEIRPDLSPDFESQMEAMVAARPALATVAIPGEPDALALEFEVGEIATDEPGPSIEDPINTMVHVVIQDGRGLLHRIDFRPLRVDLGPRRMVASLTAPLPDGSVAVPHYPLSVASIEIEVLMQEVNRKLDLKLHGIYAREQRAWSRIDMPTDGSDWQLSQSTVIGAAIRPGISLGTASGEALSLVLETGAAIPPNRVFFGVRPIGSETMENYPVVLTPGALSALSAEVGDTVSLTALRSGRARARILGTVTSFPTDEGREVVLGDLATIQALSYQPGFGLPRISEYWISVASDPTLIGAALESAPWSSASVRTRADTLASLASDPVALGTIGALAVGFVAATAFAIVGFIVSATVSARERLVEFALLRAIGLSNKQLSAWLVIEQSVLVLAGLLLGTLTGVALVSTILPGLAFTQDGSPANPGVIVTYPWDMITVLEAAIVSLLMLVAAGIAIRLRQTAVGSLLRLGEDR